MSKPKYQLIEDELRSKIQDGVYPENALIPKELELAAAYHVSRPTVRQAIQELVNEGLLEKKRHYGTIVRNRKIAQEFTHVIESYNQEMQAKGLATQTKVLAFTTEPATQEVADALQLALGAKVYKLTRLRFAGKDPIVLVTTYIPAQPLPELAQIDFTVSSLYDELEQSGYPVTHVHRKLETLAADETTSALLEVATGAPLFYFQTLGSTSKKQIVEFSQARYRGDFNYFVLDMDKDRIG
ncbi:GntR family transcriptional regulator [Lacticaseibacillus zhaodongensis]|uniref:GntR family transcriptional regulator n=1 Tax=Lacticaseibacillus zhaodongensis TaxID=2668065 RepID=UPI0012D3084F|nr:GntR family transcriptional regulator [Lacticaseibacillus zhaodongensis]